MEKVKYYYGIDGEPVDKEILNEFQLDQNDIRYVKPQKQNVFDFVGFVLNKNSILTVFPKHYFSKAELDSLNVKNEKCDDVSLLYLSINEYVKNASSSASASRYIGYKDNYVSDYPFSDFYKIYDYYQRYGLYKQVNEKTVANQKGKINWKKTINKAQKIVSGDNLFFIPLYARKNDYQNVFITGCMSFVIDTTIDMFSMFLNLNKTGYKRRKFDYEKNINYVIAQLRLAEKKDNKDINKKLINDLISFFSKYKETATGGNTHIKINYFNLVWQDMVDKYLNKYFVTVDDIKRTLIFDKAQTKSKLLFNEQRFDVDKSINNFYILTDHFAKDKENMFIFDSKYYNKVNELNYKQLSYNELLRYSYSEIKNIYSALILPGEATTKTHFELADAYIGPRKTGIYIIEQYLRPKELMESYTK